MLERRWKYFNIILNLIDQGFWSGIPNSLFWSLAFKIISNNCSAIEEGDLSPFKISAYKASEIAPLK